MGRGSLRPDSVVSAEIVPGGGGASWGAIARSGYARCMRPSIALSFQFLYNFGATNLGIPRGLREVFV